MKQISGLPYIFSTHILFGPYGLPLNNKHHEIFKFLDPQEMETKHRQRSENSPVELSRQMYSQTSDTLNLSCRRPSELVASLAPKKHFANKEPNHVRSPRTQNKSVCIDEQKRRANSETTPHLSCFPLNRTPLYNDYKIEPTNMSGLAKQV